MSVPVQDVINDIKFFTDNIRTINFYVNDTLFVQNAMPSIDNWQGGGRIDIIPETTTNTNVPADAGIASRLVAYGCDAACVDGVVTFTARADDAIISVLSKVLKDQRTRAALQTANYNLNALRHEIQPVIDAAKQTKSSLFSRGVKNLRHNVNVLDSVMSQLKMHSR